MTVLRVRSKSILILLACLISADVAFSAPASKADAPSLGTVANAAALLADNKTAARGFAELTQLTRDKNKIVAYRATAELAAYYRGKGNYPQALQLLNDFQNPAGFDKLHPAVAAEYLRCLLEAAHVLVLQKQIPRALQLLNWAETRPQPYDSALACTKYAEILEEMDEIDRAESYVNKAVDTCNKNSQGPVNSGAAIGQASATVNVSSAWGELKTRDELVKARIAQKRQERKFGKDYGLYVFMRSCADKGLYDQAAKAAVQIIKEYPKSVFAAAAGYTYGYCLLNDQRTEPDESKRIGKMFDFYQKFVRQDPAGLYRGEAMMLMGQTAMEKLWDADAAEKFYSQALTYFEKAREKANALSLYAPINGDLTKQTAPTQQLTTYNMWKRMEHNPQDPLKLYNTATAPPWYRDEMEKQCHFAIGFMQFSDGKYDDAKKHWEKISSLDPGLQEISGFPNVQKRLLHACNCKYMSFTDEEKRSFKKDRSLALKMQYAEYLFLLEQFDEANAAYDMAFAAAGDNLSAKAVIMTGIGYVIDTKGGYGNEYKKKAQVCFDWVLNQKKLENTSIYVNALLGKAFSLLGMGGGNVNAKPLLEKYMRSSILQNAGRKEYLSRALWGLCTCMFFDKQYTEARKLFDDFYTRHPKDRFYDALLEDFKKIKEEGAPWPMEK